MSLCSIVILTCNAEQYTRLCIRSIVKHTRCSYEMILVDNGSTDGTISFLNNFASSRNHSFTKSIPVNYATYNSSSKYPGAGYVQHFGRPPQRITLIRNQHNLGYAKGSNQGASIARGDSLLFLNNDTLAAKNWLENLLDCLNSSPNVAAVNPCSNFNPYAQITIPSEKLPEIEKFAASFNRKDPSKWKESSGLSGFCLLMKQKIFEQMGGFDEQFQTGCYEDTDLTLRIHQAGYRNLIAWDTFVYHYGNRSFAANSLDLAHFMAENRRKYLAKHPGAIG